MEQQNGKIEKKKTIPKKVRNKVKELREALNKCKLLKKKQKSCKKHIDNLSKFDDDLLITINDIYDSYETREGRIDENNYQDIEEENIYDDPISDVILEIFKDEEKVKVRKVVREIKREQENIEMEYYSTIDDIVGMVSDKGLNTHEAVDDDDEHIYECIDLEKLEEIKLANMAHKEMKEKKEAVKSTINHLNTFSDGDSIEVENIYCLQNISTDLHSETENPKTREDEVDSIYVKQVVTENLGDQNRHPVKALISLFEGKMEDLNKEHERIVSDMTDMVEEETSKLETEIVECEVYESYVSKQQERTGESQKLNEEDSTNHAVLNDEINHSYTVENELESTPVRILPNNHSFKAKTEECGTKNAEVTANKDSKNSFIGRKREARSTKVRQLVAMYNVKLGKDHFKVRASSN